MNFSGFANSFLSIVQSISLSDILDIALITCVIYRLLSLLKKTRALQLLKGVGLFFVIYIIATQFKMKATTFLIQNLLQVGLITLLVIFRPEIRRGLEKLGSTNVAFNNIFRKKTVDEIEIDRLRKAIASICDAMDKMSEKRTGALIVMERFGRLDTVKNSGTYINADITPELIGTIFYEGTPLHDGATIIHDGRITHAGCVLPLSDNLEISKDMGTRHRAALGLSEVSDAISLVVSEETGIISFAKNGVLVRHLDRQTLYDMLTKEFIRPLIEASDISENSGFLRSKRNEK